MKYYIQNTKIYTVEDELKEGYNLSKDNSFIDYLNGKIVKLNDEQISFYKKYPQSSIDEIYNCKINTPETIEENIEYIKYEKILSLEMYDKSSDINSFIVNGNKMWLNRNERASLGFTIQSYEAQNIETIELWSNDKSPFSLTLTISQLKSLLLSLEFYAKQCYDQTCRHKKNILELTNIDDVKTYDFKTGYPIKISI